MPEIETPIAATETTEAEPVQPAKAGNGEDHFTDLDPATLDPKSKEAYDRLQADYTRKMQDIGRRAKTVEQRETFMQSLDQDPAFRPYVEAYLQEKRGGLRQLPQSSPASDDDDLPEEWKPHASVIERIVDRRLGTRLQPLAEKVYMGNSRSLLKEFKTDHPDWSQHEQTLVRLAALPKYQHLLEDRDGMEDLWRIATYESAISNAKAQGAKSVLTRTEGKSQASLSGGGAPRGSVTEKEYGDSFAEAFAIARRKHGLT